MLGPVKKIRQYVKSHLAVSFAFELALIVFVLAFVFQTYLRSRYLDYLEETSLDTEDAVLDTIKSNVNDSLKNVIRFGSELAVSQDLFKTVQYAESSSPGAVDLHGLFIGYEYPDDIVAITAVGGKGMISEYDRFRGGTGTAMWNNADMEQLTSIYNEIMEKRSTYFQSGFPRYLIKTEPSRHPERHNMYVFHIAFPLLGGGTGIESTPYILVLTCRMNIFQDALDTMQIPDTNYTEGFIADQNSRVIYAVNKSYIGQTVEDLTEQDNIRSVSRGLNYFDWTMNVKVDETLLKQHVDRIYRQGYFLYICILAIFIVLAALIMRRILRPVSIVSDAMRKVKNGDLHNKIPIGGSHEIWQLAEEYNRMTEELKEKNLEVEKQHAMVITSLERAYEAENEALESQINAHFICNTLGTINYEAIDSGDDKVSQLIKRLSNILRYSFDRKLQEVYLRQELAWIEQYLYLQKARYEDTFDYAISFNENYGDWPCCKLMFQPFVENSILHGFEGRHSGGILTISAQENEGRLQIVIEDNGCGIRAETEKTIRHILKNEEISEEDADKVGVGIRNTVARMYMFYGTTLEISLETDPGHGTRFIFLIPLPEAAVKTGMDEAEETEE